MHASALSALIIVSTLPLSLAAPAPQWFPFTPWNPWGPQPKPQTMVSSSNAKASYAPDAPLGKATFSATVTYAPPPPPDSPYTGSFRATVTYAPQPTTSGAAVPAGSSTTLAKVVATTPAPPPPPPATATGEGVPAPQAHPNPRSGDAALLQSLRTAPNARARMALLAPADLVYDFSGAAAVASPAATTNASAAAPRHALADSTTFPALLALTALTTGGGGTGAASGAGGGVDLAALPGAQALAVGSIPPCGVVAPHLHPRASELLLVATGQVVAWLAPEGEYSAAGGGGGAGMGAVVENTLTALQMTVFPQGLLHGLWNPACGGADAVYVSAFSGGDPGEVGFVDAKSGAGAGGSTSILLPDGVAKAVEACVKRCAGAGGRTRRV